MIIQYSKDAIQNCEFVIKQHYAKISKESSSRISSRHSHSCCFSSISFSIDSLQAISPWFLSRFLLGFFALLSGLCFRFPFQVFNFKLNLFFDVYLLFWYNIHRSRYLWTVCTLLLMQIVFSDYFLYWNRRVH
ncbi:uncharacterized protein LOC107785677 [Nicotiana tabacum]|uniref:Uncharacterized protein LOC107785677 n=1 Tax=Nicotiana tabacum TaxID=4097 RepID=A0A1S3ZE22_TOBAC|nr:PREDICTED: uncharacterized protein LOC107785677 [Nicotiana tabacum]